MPQGPCSLSNLSWRTQIFSPEGSFLLIQLQTYTKGERIMMAKFLGQVDMEVAGLTRDLMELEELEEQEMREDRRQRRCWTREWLLCGPLHCHYEPGLSAVHACRCGHLPFHPGPDRGEDHQTDNLFQAPHLSKAKLLFTLWYLATGNYYRYLRFGFRWPTTP